MNAGEQYILFITPFVFNGGFNHRATLTFQGGLIETYGADAFEQVEACTLGVGEHDIGKRVQVYPNPVSDVLQIKTNVIFEKVILYALNGKKVLEQDYIRIINTSQLVNGIYILKLIANDGESVIKKFIKK